MPRTKPWYQSKTIWLNVLTVYCAVSSLSGTLSFLSKEQLEIILFSNGVANIFLRFIKDPKSLEIPSLKK